MPDTCTPFEDLPILTELRDDLDRAYTAQETPTATPRPRRYKRVRHGRVLGRLWRRPIALAGGGVGIAVAAVAAFLLASPATEPAYALTQNANGTYTITINDITTGVPALNIRLKQLGIDATAVPVTASCNAHVQIGGPGALTERSQGMLSPTNITSGSAGLLNLTPTSIPAGSEGVIAAYQSPSGQIRLTFATTTGTIPSCLPITAYKMEQTGTTTNGISTTQANPAGTTTPGN